MTTTGQPDGASWRDWSEWWAHCTPWAWVTLLATAIGTVLLGLPVVAWTVFAVAAVLALILNMIRHDVTLCSRCLANIPTDPQRAIRRKGWALWLFHHRWLIYVSWLAMWAARDHVSPTFSGLFFISMFLWMCLVTTVELLHRPLQLWCPRCPKRGDGGDDGESHTTPTPRPTPVGVKQQ